MNTKIVTILAVSAAVIAAAVAAIVVSMNRADEAKAYAEAEAAQADAAAAEARTERALADQEQEKRRAEEAKQKTAEAERDKAKADEAAAKADAEEAKASEAAAKLAADAERAKAEAAKAARDQALAVAETARAEAAKTNDYLKAQNAKAEAEVAKLEAEKVKAEKIIAEAKALELRKIDFETLEQQMLEWKLDLEERERAIAPEKAITDLEWAGGMEDSVIDADGNVVKQTKKEYDPETDMHKPETTRRLAKAERQVRVATSNDVVKARNSVIGTMEKLYVKALRENRVIDADFYKKTILSMYPDWKFAGEKKPE